MSLKFYFAKSHSYMNEIMGENGLYQISLTVNKLSFHQFICIHDKNCIEKLKNLKQIDNILENQFEMIQIENDDDEKQSKKQNEIMLINVYGSRFNNLTNHEIKIPCEYNLTDDIGIIMKYIEQSVYSFSQSKTAFANYSLKLFSQSFYKLNKIYPQINVIQQGSSDFILFPSYQIKLVRFSKDKPAFIDFDEQYIKKNHDCYFDGSSDDDVKIKQESQVNQNYFQLKIVAQIFVFKKENKLIIKNINGNNVYEINEFSRKHLTLNHQSQMVVKIIQNELFRLLSQYEYFQEKYVDLKYYFASKYVKINKKTCEKSIFKFNIDFSEPQSLSMLFIIMVEGKNNFNYSEEFQLEEDFIKRFSFSDKLQEEEINFLKSIESQDIPKIQQNEHYQLNQESLSNIFKNLIHYSSQQISDETYLYRDALCRTFEMSQKELQIFFEQNIKKLNENT